MGPSGPPMGSMSPSSSPRLPSPPPFPEVQIGPKSPGIAPIQGNAMPDLESNPKLDHEAMRRIRPGTKAADFSGPPLVPLSELDSPFQLQEHLKALHYHHTHSSDEPKTTKPLTRATATEIAVPPPSVDRSLWLYELCRLLVMKANVVTVLFFREEPPCSASTCPEMRASEWQYLCAVHEPPKSCCAIDYCCHTLEWAADTLTSTKTFPSRLQIGETPVAAQGAVRQLTNIMRRVYRIFAHAWFSHREVFWQLENDEGLYMLFKTVCDEYHLIPEENYTVPPEAEGLTMTKKEEKLDTPSARRSESEVKAPTEENEEKTTISTGATTRRHKHTPSMGSTVATIQEGDEDDRDSESPTKAGKSPVLSEQEAATPTNDEPSQARDLKGEPKEEPSSISTDIKAEPTNDAVTELSPAAPAIPADPIEANHEGKDVDEERPSTAVSTKKGVSSETQDATNTHEVKVEEMDKPAEGVINE